MFLPQVTGGAVAALAFGALTDRVQARWLIPISLSCLATAQLLVPLIAPGILVLVYAVALGVSGGSSRSIVAAFIPKWFGTAHIGSISGVITFAGVLGSAVGPVTFSLGRDWLGGYGATAAWLAVLPIAVGLAAMTLLSNRRRAAAT